MGGGGEYRNVMTRRHYRGFTTHSCCACHGKVSGAPLSTDASFHPPKFTSCVGSPTWSSLRASSFLPTSILSPDVNKQHNSVLPLQDSESNQRFHCRKLITIHLRRFQLAPHVHFLLRK